MEIEFNVAAVFKGLEDILATATFRRQDNGGVLVEVQQSIDDDGPADLLFELDAVQTKALRAALA